MRYASRKANVRVGSQEFVLSKWSLAMSSDEFTDFAEEERHNATPEEDAEEAAEIDVLLPSIVRPRRPRFTRLERLIVLQRVIAGDTNSQISKALMAVGYPVECPPQVFTYYCQLPPVLRLRQEHAGLVLQSGLIEQGERIKMNCKLLDEALCRAMGISGDGVISECVRTIRILPIREFGRSCRCSGYWSIWRGYHANVPTRAQYAHDGAGTRHGHYDCLSGIRVSSGDVQRYTGENAR